MNDLFAGLLLIAVGFLVGRYPMSIGVYYMLSKEKRDSVDLIGIARMLRKWLVGIGICLIAVTTVLAKLGYWEMKDMFTIILLGGGCVVMFAKILKYLL